MASRSALHEWAMRSLLLMTRALTQMLLCQKAMSQDSKSNAGYTGFKIECWLHGAEFDLRTGEALTLPANIALKTYAVSIDGNAVTVEI